GAPAGRARPWPRRAPTRFVRGAPPGEAGDAAPGWMPGPPPASAPVDLGATGASERSEYPRNTEIDAEVGRRTARGEGPRRRPDGARPAAARPLPPGPRGQRATGHRPPPRKPPPAAAATSGSRPLPFPPRARPRGGPGHRPGRDGPSRTGPGERRTPVGRTLRPRGAVPPP